MPTPPLPAAPADAAVAPSRRRLKNAVGRRRGAGTAAKKPAAGEDRRAHVLDAARRVFEAQGLEGANMRAIAREAGYTPGALYFHYKNKEEIYGDLLSGSLSRLHEATRAAGADTATTPSPADRVLARALALYDYYAGRPDEITLGLYLFHGIHPRGLTRELNRQLNAKLWDALAEIHAAFLETGASPEAAMRDTTALFGHCVGLLVLVHTGRIRMFGQDGRGLFRRFAELLLVRGEGGDRHGDERGPC